MVIFGRWKWEVGSWKKEKLGVGRKDGSQKSDVGSGRKTCNIKINDSKF